MGARDYISLVREQAWLILGATVVGLLAAVALAVLTPRSYASAATFYVVSTNAGLETASDRYSGAQLSAERVKSYGELLQGARVAEDASRLLGGRLTPEQVQSSVTSESTTDTVILTMTATDRTPEGAMTLAQAVTTAFVRLVNQLETTNGPGSPPGVVVQVVQAPALPGVPTSPRPKFYLLVGGLAGLLVGFGAAVARRSLRRSISTTAELEDAAGTAVLAIVPEDGRTKQAPVVLVDEPKSGRAAWKRAEAYQRVRTNLEFANVDGNCSVLVVTSALHDEGKTVTACNLAVALAGAGHRVALVEADLRRPRVLTTLGVATPPAGGLSRVLTGSVALDDALLPWHGVDVLPSGEAPARPNELLASHRTFELLKQLRRRYEFVLLDAPPVLPVADAATLGRHTDGVLLVTRAGRTSREAVSTATQYLHAVSVSLVGAILSHGQGQPGLKPPAPSATTRWGRRARPDSADPAAPGAAPEPDGPAPEPDGPAEQTDESPTQEIGLSADGALPTPDPATTDNGRRGRNPDRLTSDGTGSRPSPRSRAVAPMTVIAPESSGNGRSDYEEQ